MFFAQIFVILGLLWLLICLIYIGRSAYTEAQLNDLNTMLWVVLTLAFCLTTLVGSYILLNGIILVSYDLLILLPSPIGFMIYRLSPVLLAFYISYKGTFYVIDNMNSIYERIFK